MQTQKTQNDFDILKELESIQETINETNDFNEEIIESENLELNTISEENNDIIDDFSLENEELNETDILKNIESEETEIETTDDFSSIENDLISEIQEINEETKKPVNKIKSSIVFLLRYITTSSVIFVLLMAITNFASYKSIALSYLSPERLEEKQTELYSAMEESKVVEKKEEEKEDINILEQELKDKIKEEQDLNMVKNKTYHSMSKLLHKSNNEDIKIDIDMTPYENRVVIPKIGKNIPLIDVKKRTVESIEELENVFMKELGNGIVRYPGSALPGNEGNSFIFGHSSNFPWMEGNYNDVFALLDKVVYDDEVVVYYGQEKYTYKIREKRVIKPGEVNILKRNKGKAEITLMTCWPVGTTLNRLIVIGELVEEK